MERKFLPVSIALLTVSDTRIIENDKSGNLLVNKISKVRKNHSIINKHYNKKYYLMIFKKLYD